MSYSNTILIVDDEKIIRNNWAEALSMKGFQIYQAGNSDEAMLHCEERTFDLALLDLKMPNSPMDGLELLVWLHNHFPNMDQIMLTGYATLDTSITALRQGAYDYLIKPVSIHQVIEVVQTCMTKRKEAHDRQQLISQIESLLQQLKGEVDEEEGSTQQAGRILESPDLFIDRKKRLVVHRGHPVELTATEFDMLDFLATHSDRVVTARELVRAVQGYDIDEIDARPIARVNVRRLRQKLEDEPNNPRYIITVRTRGYRFTG